MFYNGQDVPTLFTTHLKIGELKWLAVEGFDGVFY